ncbi:hypothetical protein EPYR_03911 [Erwinia pyrifoliae DSM 12163]|nr:hypothetical protein EPYR_03911 [Erwinia pyrifoliae DSM 12163]
MQPLHGFFVSVAPNSVLITFTSASKKVSFDF